MLRVMCKSKILRATVTDADLNYVGSITIDRELTPTVVVVDENNRITREHLRAETR